MIMFLDIGLGVGVGSLSCTHLPHEKTALLFPFPYKMSSINTAGVCFLWGLVMVGLGGGGYFARPLIGLGVNLGGSRLRAGLICDETGERVGLCPGGLLTAAERIVGDYQRSLSVPQEQLDPTVCTLVRLSEQEGFCKFAYFVKSTWKSSCGKSSVVLHRDPGSQGLHEMVVGVPISAAS